MTEEPASKITIVLLSVIAIGLFGCLVSVATTDISNQATQSCMDSVVTPDPEAIDYDIQALEFTTEIRKCLRG